MPITTQADTPPPSDPEINMFDPSEADTLVPEGIDGTLLQTSLNFEWQKFVPGRFKILKTLGRGGHGTVLLAKDTELDRVVAIKFVLPKKEFHPGNNSAFLDESKILASLDHPHIVPIYDVGKSQIEDSNAFYIVSKYVEGGTLAQAIRNRMFSFAEISRVIRLVALALQYSHEKGLVHLDVKPDNILLDKNRQPFLADFGLAMRHEMDPGSSLPLGTPAYMSPEQVNGEGHRIDGRSDTFSLGIILYEMLAGKRPFDSDTVAQTMEKIRSGDIIPPSHWNREIPRELERICLKAISRRMMDRYQQAWMLADDLGDFERQDQENQTRENSVAVLDNFVYRGLRSFEPDDAGFFLELLPGPKNRDGLPLLVRFWNDEIESEKSNVPVGVIYGPSGCGKSSLVKAGILPRLNTRIFPVYLESSPEETETSLLGLLKNQLSICKDAETVEDAFKLLRSESDGVSKTLIVLDQFEQWILHHEELDSSSLAKALRQADGIHVQVIVLVRDDFMLGINRLMGHLEYPIQEGVNFTLVDLFEKSHAGKVLRAVGFCLGKFPSAREISASNRAFLDKAVQELSVEGRCVPVRLMMFAEMMKNRDWSPEVLDSLGGLDGLGIQFFEQILGEGSPGNFSGSESKIARDILGALLPGDEVDIKGAMQGLEKLRERIDRADEPAFASVLRKLDQEFRLITPVLVPTMDGINGLHYILAHDYLVASLRKWLVIKKGETSEGRAELKLSELASFWKFEKGNRHLPSLAEYVSIRWFVPVRKYTSLQSRMMTSAGFFHLKRILAWGIFLTVTLILILAPIFIARKKNQDIRVQGLVHRLMIANGDALEEALSQLDGDMENALPILKRELDGIPKEDSRRFRLVLALLPGDESFLGESVHAMLESGPKDYMVFLNRLKTWTSSLERSLQKVVDSPDRFGEKAQLRALGAMVQWSQQNKQLPVMLELGLANLLGQNLFFLEEWAAVFEPAKEQLLPLLLKWVADPRKPANERDFATLMALRYAKARPEVVFRLLVDADLKNARMVMDEVQSNKNVFLPHFKNIVRKDFQDLPHGERLRLANEQGIAAACLIGLNQSDGLDVFFNREDPTARSAAQNLLPYLGVGAAPVINSMKNVKDPEILAGLIVSLGDFDTKVFDFNTKWKDELLSMYAENPNSGVHGALDWLLRKKLGLSQECDRVEQALQGKPFAGREWHINTLGQTMVAIKGPVKYRKGSLLEEPNRSASERFHDVIIPRSFAIGMKEVTSEQFLKLVPGHVIISEACRTPDSPANNVNWFAAAAYCNLLTEKEFSKEDCCYLPNKDGQYGPGMKMAEGFLSKKGYRLPTDGEWEFACRAGTETTYHFGNDPAMIPRFGFCQTNSDNHLWPVGTLRPNNLGLFDMAGNAYEWIQDRHLLYPLITTHVDSEVDLGSVDRSQGHVLRNGCFYNPPGSLRSASRSGTSASDGGNSRGLRLARTLE
jgi:serine/threonine protein kinase/formylglycine-generating enzyme required for sulfatase activity